MPKNVYVYIKDEAKQFSKSTTRCEMSGKMYLFGERQNNQDYLLEEKPPL